MYAAENDLAGRVASRMGQVVGTEAGSRGVEPARSTLHTAIANAHRVCNRLDETGERLNAMAEVAEQLATRLCGSYPTEGPNKNASGAPSERGPMSKVEAINAAVDGLHPRITGFESPMSRICRAFEVIEQANG